MARKSSDMSTQQKKSIKEALNMTKIAGKLLELGDDTYQIRSGIDLQASRFDGIINRNLEMSKGIAGGNILDFAQTVRQQEAQANRTSFGANDEQDLRKLMSTNSTEIYSYFQEVYQNKYIEIADLKFIAKFIPALGEAVKCLLDSITNSDDLSGTISRTIQPNAGMTKEDIKKLTDTIESFEKEMKLQRRLKNIVYRTAIVSGKYYVYNIAYSELFEQYSKDRAESMNMMGTANLNKLPSNNPKGRVSSVHEATQVYESTRPSGNQISLDQNWGIAIESVHDAINVDELKSIVQDAKVEYQQSYLSTEQKKHVSKSLDAFEAQLVDRASKVKIIHSGIPEEVLEDIPAFEAYQSNVARMKVNDPNYKGLFDSYFGSTPVDMETGVVAGADAPNMATFRAEKNFNITGTYIRYIDPKNMIPVRLMGETIGYYYIQTAQTAQRRTNAANANSNILGTDAFSGAFNIGALNDQRKTSIIDNIVASISDSICRNFSKKYVAKNSDFKKAIADCITFNGFLDNEYHIQFIDPKYVIEFTVNEDEEGNGESVLADSLFPAKLLLSLMTARMLNYLNLTGSKQIAHIAKGPIDSSTGRQTQRLIRNMQEAKITFSDLLSTNLVFNKFARNKNVLVPQGKDGTHLVDFEVMDGQSIDMNPEYENKLEQMAILGTGVPSVIMEYLGQTDFSKGFETGNIKYASRVSSLQTDMEEPTTELYNNLIRNSNLSEDVKARLVDKFTIKLNRPKSLVVANNNEYLGSLQQLLQMIAQIMYGENTSDPKDQRSKDEFMRLAVKINAPYIDWAAFEELKKQATMTAANPKDQPDEEAGGSAY